MKVYHGSTAIVERPIVSYGRDKLDFGKGFYVTTMREQAIKWARQLARRMPAAKPILNTYDLKEDWEHYKVLRFSAYDGNWLDFIVANRKGEELWKSYDLIEGGIANDKVFDTIEIYMSGQITKEVAIGRLAYERPNNQICITSQQLADDCLTFIKSENANA